MELITIVSLAISAIVIARLSSKLGKNALELPQVADEDRLEENKELKSEQ
jgi:hypothetical protein